MKEPTYLMEKQFPLDIPLWDSVVVFSVSVEIVPVLSFPSENLTLKQFIKWHINAAVTTKTTIILIIPPINDRCCLRYAYLVCLVDIRAIDQRSKVQLSFLLVRHFHVVSASFETRMGTDLTFSSRRSPVVCLHGCVASSQPLASSIGLGKWVECRGELKRKDSQKLLYSYFEVWAQRIWLRDAKFTNMFVTQKTKNKGWQ